MSCFPLIVMVRAIVESVRAKRQCRNHTTVAPSPLWDSGDETPRSIHLPKRRARKGYNFGSEEKEKSEVELLVQQENLAGNYREHKPLKRAHKKYGLRDEYLTNESKSRDLDDPPVIPEKSRLRAVAPPVTRKSSLRRPPPTTDSSKIGSPDETTTLRHQPPRCISPCSRKRRSSIF